MGANVRRIQVARVSAAIVSAAVLAACSAMPRTDATQSKAGVHERVDLELMTWVEVKAAIAKGRTTALVFNGGTETRGPQAVNGGHTLVAHAKVVAIAQQLGNAIAAPVLPFSPNNANAGLPGTIGLKTETFQQINREITEQLITNGFRSVVLMGDHGGGQQQLADLAQELDAKYAPQGIRVVYCEDVYKKSNADFDAWIDAKGLSGGGHASINDTSEMMYLQPKPDAWVRGDKLAEAVGTPRRRGAPADPNAPPPNGVSGDGRKSTAVIGKVGYDMHVDEAVLQIRQLLGQK
jgi:creatinine amidohydrolase/Fe(II)-dependent formamide hydrolase-like protein